MSARIGAILTCFVILWGIVRGHTNSSTSDDTRFGSRVLSRKKRHLLFPPGSVLQLGYCLNVPTLIPDGLWSYGLTFGTNWELPSDPLVRTPHREAEVVHRRHRRDLYGKLLPVLTMMGLDGQSCLLRSLCESGQRPKTTKGSFVEEILYSIFTLPQSETQNDMEEQDMMQYDAAFRKKQDCAKLFPSCSSSLMNLVVS